jgi:amidase
MSALGLPASRIGTLVRWGELTPREAVTPHLERIAAYDGLIGAFAHLREPEVVLAEADALHARPGLERLPLAGVPIAVKDNVAVAGEPSRHGSAATTSERSGEDHEVVARLRAAGALVVGLTRMPELGVFATSDGAFGAARNPWDPSRTPGGSSGGSAAAVSAGMVPVAHGNDGLGSIRIPAACCGLVGIKPGRGVVPAGIGADDWSGMAENGPLATTVADAALMLSVMAAQHELADVRMPERAGSRPVRVALAPGSPLPGLPVDRDMRAATEGVARLLGDCGCDVTPVDFDYPTTAAVAAVARWFAGTASDVDDVDDAAALMPRTRRHATLGRAMARAGLTRASWADQWRAKAREFFAEYDVLLTPALARRPPSSTEWSRRGWLANVASNARYAPFTPPWNLAGLPAAVVPAGRHPSGLPLGVQMVAGDGGEPLLLGLAAVVEDRLPWPRIAPTLSHPPAAG